MKSIKLLLNEEEIDFSNLKNLKEIIYDYSKKGYFLEEIKDNTLFFQELHLLLSDELKYGFRRNAG